MKTIAIYSRKSKFTGKGDSIENQIEMCKSHVNNSIGKDAKFLIYEDEGFSGGNTDRPQFKKMLKAATSRQFDILICYRLDRISRNVADFSLLVQKLQELNIDFISIKEQFDTSTPMGRAMMYISSVFAQLERETIAERVRDNMLEMAKNGQWTGGKIPVGFKSKKVSLTDESGLKREKTKLVIDNEKIQFVKFLYEKYLELGSLHKLETHMHQNNIRSKNNIIFEKSTLKIILQNPIYVKASKNVTEYLKNSGWAVYGEADGIHSLLTYNKTESATINNKSIKVKKDESEKFAAVSNIEGPLDEKLWLDVQKQFDKNRNTFPRLGKTHNALLTGKVRCGYCKENMLIRHGNISKVTGEKLFYYVCSLKIKSRRKLCKNKNASASYLESLVIKSLKSLGMNKKEYIKSINSKNLKSTESSESKNQKLLIEKSIQDKEKQINILTEKISRNEDAELDEILLKKLRELKDELNSLNTKLNFIVNTIEESKANLLDIDFISKLLEKCSDIDTFKREEQKQIINGLIDVIYWYGDDNKIKIKFYGTEDEDSDYITCNEGELEQLSLKLFFCSHSMSSVKKNYIFSKLF